MSDSYVTAVLQSDLASSRYLTATNGSGILIQDNGPLQPINITTNGLLSAISTTISSNGYIIRTGASTAVSRAFANSATISVTNPDGSGGQTSFNVANNSSQQNIQVQINGTTVVPVSGTLNIIPGSGMGASVTGNSSVTNLTLTSNGGGGGGTIISQISVSVAGSADVTLSAPQCNNQIIQFTGLLTGNIHVFFQNNVNLYELWNNTTGAFTLTVQYVSGGNSFVLPQNSKLSFYSDGANLYSTPNLPTTGLLKNNGANTIPSIAVLGTDYYGPGVGSMTTGGLIVTADGSAAIQLPTSSSQTISTSGILVWCLDGSVPMITSDAGAAFTGKIVTSSNLGQTTQGDILVGNGSGGYTPLALGATGTVPKSNGTTLVYSSVGTGNVVGPGTTIVGDIAVFNNTTGTLLADSSLPIRVNNTNDNIFVGVGVGTGATGGALRNVGIGNSVLTNGTLGVTDHVGIGYNTLVDSAAGARNLGIGNNVLSNCLTSDNVGVGFDILGFDVTGAQNIGFGSQVYTNKSGGGGANTGIGYNVGTVQTNYDHSTFLGSNTDASANNLTNITAVGYGAKVAVSNTMILGNAITGVGVNSIANLVVTANSGSNGTCGTANLNGITNVAVATTSVKATSLIFLTPITDGTPANQGIVSVNSKSAGSGFNVVSTNAADVAIVQWFIVNPV